MKKLLYIFLILLTGCTNEPAQIITEQNAGQIIDTSVGKELSIQLNGNATTGYAWNFSSDSPTAYQIIEDDYVENKHPEGMVGVGGLHIYHIKTLQSGQFTITARYYRPWEEFNPKKDKQISFSIDVK